MVKKSKIKHTELYRELKQFVEWQVSRGMLPQIIRVDVYVLRYFQHRAHKARTLAERNYLSQALDHILDDIKKDDSLALDTPT